MSGDEFYDDDVTSGLDGYQAGYDAGYAAGVRVTGEARGDPDEDVQEAVRRALLYVEQREPRPMKPLAVIRALAQDGYRVVRVGDAGLDVERLARALLKAQRFAFATNETALADAAAIAREYAALAGEEQP